MPGQPADKPVVAVVGATGLVGREVLAILETHPLGRGEVRVFASSQSAGGAIEVGGRARVVEEPQPGRFEGCDLVFLCVGSELSRVLAPAAVERGAVVIDNSSAFRMDDGVPLVVPEINGAVLDAGAGPRIIANPNCSTIIALMAVTPLHRAVRVRRMVVSTYQAASGGGAAVLDELQRQAADHGAGRPLTQDVLGRPYLFNVFSHDSPVGANGYNDEEMKLRNETRRIWADDTVQITATCVRVPVLRAHSESINLTFADPLYEGEARELLAAAPGVRLVDDRQANRFPEPVDAAGIDDVLVGRIRTDMSQRPGMGMDLFVSGDQLRKGAALNAVQIAERVAAAAPVPI